MKNYFSSGKGYTIYFKWTWEPVAILFANRDISDDNLPYILNLSYFNMIPDVYNKTIVQELCFCHLYCHCTVKYNVILKANDDEFI